MKQTILEKKHIVLFAVLILTFMIFADGLVYVTDTAEVATGDLSAQIKQVLSYAIYTFLLGLVGLLAQFCIQAIQSFVESKKDSKFYIAYQKLEELAIPVILEAQEKAVKKIKEKYGHDTAERYVELGKVNQSVCHEIEKQIPEKVKKDIEKSGENTRGLIPKIVENNVKLNKIDKYIDFRKIRDKLNIPKI